MSGGLSEQIENGDNQGCRIYVLGLRSILLSPPDLPSRVSESWFSL